MQMAHSRCLEVSKKERERSLEGLRGWLRPT